LISGIDELNADPKRTGRNRPVIGDDVLRVGLNADAVTGRNRAVVDDAMICADGDSEAEVGYRDVPLFVTLAAAGKEALVPSLIALPSAAEMLPLFVTLLSAPALMASAVLVAVTVPLLVIVLRSRRRIAAVPLSVTVAPVWTLTVRLSPVASW